MFTSLPVSPNARPRTADKRKSTLVFAVNVAHVRALTKTFQSAGIDARYLVSGTPSAERVASIDAFKAGEFPVLLNCGKLHSPPTSRPRFTLHFYCTALLTEGTDIPNIDCVVIARPTRSRNVFVQMVSCQLCYVTLTP